MNRKGVLRVLGVAALATALAGCLKVDVSLEINDDESIDGHVIMAVSDELAQLTGQDPETLAQQFEDDVMEDAPEGVTQESYEDDEFQGTRLVLDGVALEEFDFSDDETLSIVHEGDEYQVNGMLDMTGADELGDLSGEEQELIEGFADSMDVRVAITFPGDVIEHNGELEGRTVTWTPEFGETLDIQARAEDSAGSSFPWWIVGVVAALVAVAVLVLLALRRRSGGSTTAPEPVHTAGDEPIRDQQRSGESPAYAHPPSRTAESADELNPSADTMPIELPAPPSTVEPPDTRPAPPRSPE
jgi:hypothetical protein